MFHKCILSRSGISHYIRHLCDRKWEKERECEREWKGEKVRERVRLCTAHKFWVKNK